MSPFLGFLPNTAHVPVPAPFFGPILEDIANLAELQCALRLLFLLHRQRGPLRFITARVLAADVILVRALQHAAPDAQPQEVLKQALSACLERGLFLRLPVQVEERSEELLFLNTSVNQQAVKRFHAGELALPSLPRAAPLEDTPLPRDIFTLYEENIGIISPMIAERLKELEEEHPPNWIQEALGEAVRYNHHNLAYIEAILRRWRDHGRGDGAPGRHPEKVPISQLPRHARGPLLRRKG